MNDPHWWKNQHGSSVWNHKIPSVFCVVQLFKTVIMSMLHEKPPAALLPDAWERIFGCGSKSGALRFTGFLRISSKNNPLYVYSVWIVKIKCTIDKYVWWLHGILWVLVLRYAHMCTGQSEHAVTANSLRSQQRHEQKGLNDVRWLSDFRCANC